MAIFYRVKNVSLTDINLAGLYIDGTPEDQILPADNTFYDLYTARPDGSRLNTMGKIQQNPYLLRAIRNAEIEVDYNLTDSFRGEVGEAELAVSPSPMRLTRHLDTEAASGPPILPIFNTAQTRTIPVLEDGTTVSTFGAVLDMLWSLPAEASVGDGWSVTVRNDSDVRLELVSPDVDMIRPGGPRALLLSEGEEITLVYNSSLGGIWVSLTETQQTFVADINPTAKNYGAVPSVADLPAGPLPGGFASVRATDATFGTYQESGGAWVKVGGLARSGHELAQILGYIPPPVEYGRESSHSRRTTTDTNTTATPKVYDSLNYEITRPSGSWYALTISLSCNLDMTNDTFSAQVYLNGVAYGEPAEFRMNAVGTKRLISSTILLDDTEFSADTGTIDIRFWCTGGGGCTATVYRSDMLFRRVE